MLYMHINCQANVTGSDFDLPVPLFFSCDILCTTGMTYYHIHIYYKSSDWMMPLFCQDGYCNPLLCSSLFSGKSGGAMISMSPTH